MFDEIQLPPPDLERGCGTREDGGLYAEIALSPFGEPLERYLLDPPVPYVSDCHLGVQLVERMTAVRDADGTVRHVPVVHLLDYVGANGYPFVADFVEEARRHGVSRRLPKNLPVERLSPESRLILIHGRGVVLNPGPIRTGQTTALDRDGVGRHTFAGTAPAKCCARHVASERNDWTHLPHGDEDSGGWCTRDWRADAVPTVAHVPAGPDNTNTPFVSVDLDPTAVQSWGPLDAAGLASGLDFGDPTRPGLRDGVEFYRVLASGERYRVFPPNANVGATHQPFAPTAPGGSPMVGGRGFGVTASGIFASFPIARLAVASVGGAVSAASADTFAAVSARLAAAASGVPVEVVRA